MISKSAMVDGITMRWEEVGEGMPVVLIHGIPTSPALWRHVAPLIANARCWALPITQKSRISKPVTRQVQGAMVQEWP